MNGLQHGEDMVQGANGVSSTIPMRSKKRIALIAHDERKGELLEWARHHERTLRRHTLYATSATGRMLERGMGLAVTCFLSGLLGGDQQVGAAIVEGRIDCMVFFWDPLHLQPHDVDVKALLRIAVVHNVPVACNLATADFLLSSPFMHGRYDRVVECKTSTRSSQGIEFDHARPA